MDYGTWENSMLDGGKLITDIEMEDVSELMFGTSDEAKRFMSVYAKAKGFSLRIRDSKKNVLDKVPHSIWWVCSCEGTREKKYLEMENRVREHRRITRFNCGANFRALHITETNTWRMTKFVTTHSHNLAPDLASFLRSHRQLTQADSMQIKSLRLVGIRPCQIMQLFAHQSGGIDKVGFVNKDLYNHVGKSPSEERMSRDFEKSIDFLESKQVSDPGLFFRYTVTEDGNWENLFWCDSGSIDDYKVFGDVVTFDSTHSTNVYGKPMVLFTGVNNHNLTCIFGCALLERETKESYQWLLKALLEANGEQPPDSVLTDGDKAMKSAIKKVLKKTAHRLCTWHILRNVTGYVPSTIFQKAFSACMMTECKLDFQSRWSKLVEDYGLGEKNWATSLYKDKKKWSYAWHRNRFFAGQHANSRSESINYVTKLNGSNKNTLYEMLHHFDTVLEQVRYHERAAQFDTLHTTNVLVTDFPQIEQQASEIYTRGALKKFLVELRELSSVIVEEESDPDDKGSVFYPCSMYTHRRSTFLVEFNSHNSSISCTCKKFQQEGFICRHSLVVFRYRHATVLPNKCFLLRWTRFAKDKENVTPTNVIDTDDALVIRHGALASLTRELAYHGSKDPVRFNHVRDIVTQALNLMNNEDSSTFPSHANPSTTLFENPQNENSTLPAVAQRRNRQPRCSICGEGGHNKQTCQQRATVELLPPVSESTQEAELDHHFWHHFLYCLQNQV